MTGPTDAPVLWHLRRLDAPGLAAVVADLWAARGFAVDRSEGGGHAPAVVARRDGDERLLLVVPGRRPGPVGAVTGVLATARRRLAGRTVERAGTGERSGDAGGAVDARPPGEAIDAVVTAGDGTGRAGRLADAVDARLVTGADLESALWYSVDREDAVAICERHLGAPPANLTPPIGRRTADRASGLASRDPRTVRVVSTALVLLVAGASIAAVGPWDTGAAGADRADGGDGQPPDQTTVTLNAPPVASIPGLGPDGITDVNALASAHRRALADSRYRRQFTFRGPRSPDGDASWGWAATVVSTGERYIWKSTYYRFDARTLELTVYFDGEAGYIKREELRNATYRPLAAVNESTLPEGAADRPWRVSARRVRELLATPTTAVTGTIVQNGAVLYRVVGSGRPRGVEADIRNYTFEALIDRNGVVRDLEAAYGMVAADGSESGRIRWSYTSVGTATLGVPDWYRERFAETTTPPGTLSTRDTTTAVEAATARTETVTGNATTATD
ncbi:MAG: hypothetical protein ABEJ08_02795 [Halobacteriaceae archaeon]